VYIGIFITHLVLDSIVILDEEILIILGCSKMP